MRTPLFWLFYVLLFFSPRLAGQGQQYTVSSYTADDGLAEDKIWSIYQDDDGIVWLGTQDGISRYDGYGFRNLRTLHTGTGPASVTDNIIGRIAASRDSRKLWIGTTTAGLFRIDRLTEEVESFPHLLHSPADESTLTSINIENLHEDESGVLWIGTHPGLNSYNVRTGSVQRYRVDPNVPASAWQLAIVAIQDDGNGLLWLGTQSGVYTFHKKTCKFAIFDSALTNQLITAMILTSSGELWVGTERGLYIYSNNRTQRHNLFRGKWITALFDVGREVLVGTHAGMLFRCDATTRSFIPVDFQEAGKSARPVTTLLQDNTGILWIGTGGGGLWKLAPKAIRFDWHRYADARPQAAMHRSVWSFGEMRDGTIWIGTARGVAALDTRKNEYTLVPGAPTGFPVRGIVEDEEVLWLALLEKGLVRWNRTNGKLTYYVKDQSDSSKLNNDKIYCLLKDRYGALWAGMNGSEEAMLAKFDPATERFANLKDSAAPNWVLSMCEDRSGMFWLGTWVQGLESLDRSTGAFTYYYPHGNPGTSTPKDRMSVVHESEREPNTLWIGTLGGGLFRFDTRSKTFVTFTESDGLANNTIYGILEDSFGNLWLSTNNGISRFDPDTKAFKNYDVNDGLQGNEFNLGAYLKASDGTLYFGGDNGVNSFKPEDDVDSHPPRVHFTRVKLFDAPLNLDKPLSETSFIELDHNRNQVTFEFIGLHYKDPQKNQYAYMLEGYDRDWVKLGTKREASFAHLEPAEYVFKVKAANCDGVWSEARTVRLSIALPFWRTWWFYTLSGGLLFCLGYGWHLYQVRTRLRHTDELERARKDEEERVRAKLKADVHDTFAGVIANISGLAKDLTREASAEGAEARRKLKKIVTYAETLLQGYSTIQWQYDPQKDTLFDLIAHLKQYGDLLLTKKGQSLKLGGNIEALTAVHLPMIWREQLMYIFCEAMNNIVKHAPTCSSVTLETGYANGEVTMTLCDNGTGFNEHESEHANGVNHMRERAALLGGRLDIESCRGSGTTVRFTGKLPLGRVLSAGEKG